MNALKAALFVMIATGFQTKAEWLPLWPGDAPGGAKPVVVIESEGDGDSVGWPRLLENWLGAR